MDRRWRGITASRWLLPVALLLFSSWEIWLGGQTHAVGPLPVTAATAAAAALLLVRRRDSPLLVQLAAATVTVLPWLVWGAPQNGGIFLIGMVATYAVGRWAERPAAFLGLVVTTGWALAQLALDPMQASVKDGWGWALWGVSAWAAGAWVRQQAELSSRRATERQSAARAALAEQRLEIARDLHDVLANSLGVVVIQAEAAEELSRSDPDRALVAMRRVQATAREALRDVRGILGSLRDSGTPAEGSVDRDSPDDESSRAITRPDADDIGALVQRMRDAGLPLVYHRDGDCALPSSVGQVIYRFMQESLSNVIRHAGPVPTRASLRIERDAVTAEVVNEPAHDRHYVRVDGSVGEGNGIRGMRERLQALGGTLELWQPPAGGLGLRTTVPLKRPT